MTQQHLQIGSYLCDGDAAWFTITSQGIIGNTGRMIKQRVSWDIKGYCRGTTTGEVDSKVVALESAIRPGIDIVFSLGSTMRLVSSSSIEGTQLRKFSWLEGYDGVRGFGAEGVLRRTFNLIMYADYLWTSDTDIIGWHEAFTIIGTGGPHIVPVTSLAGAVAFQQTEAYTPIWVIQSGLARGLTSYPSAATPRFGSASGFYYPKNGITVTQETPKHWGLNRNTDYVTRWQYKGMTGSTFASPIPGVF
jgi:hypothetical protein